MNKEILHIKELSVGYSQPICSGINASVRQGELVGLTGKNGSGKTTLIHSILGLQNLLNGIIEIQSENIQNWELKKRAKEISVVFSRLNQIPAVPVFDLVALGRLPHQNDFSKRSNFDIDKIENALQLVGIEHLKRKLATQLSDGQLQMVMIARALAQETELVIMDEPTSHLDIENQFKIFELIYKLSKETSKTFIVASHQIELVLQNASQLWWLDEGRFYAGFPEQIAYEQRIFEKLSQEKIRFDYQKGNFQFQHLKLKKVNLISDGSELAFWAKHALERNGFELATNELERIVKIDNKKIYFEGNSYESISAFIGAIGIFATKWK